MTFDNQKSESMSGNSDDLIRFLNSCEYFFPETKKAEGKNDHFLEKFVNPTSIAFFGANGNLLTNIASQQLINLYDNQYQGNIYPIHPKRDKVFGVKAYKNVLDVPETP